MNHSNKKTTELEKLKGHVFFACIFFYTIDCIFNTGFIYNALAVDGVTGSDLLISIMVGMTWLVLMIFLSKIGIRVLPTLTAKRYRQIFPIWLGFAFLTALVSTMLTVLFLGLPLAQEEYLNQVIRKANNVATSTIKAQRQAESQDPLLLSIGNRATVLLENERRSGAVCSVGSGRGECANIIQSLQSVSVSARKSIIESKAEALISIARIEESQDDLRRLLKNADMPYQEKSFKIKEVIELILGEVETLKRGIPIAALKSAIDAYSREYSSSGISERGAARIEMEFRPIARRLKREMGDLKEASNRKIDNIEGFNSLEMICKGAGALLPIFAIALILGFAPLGMCLCVLVAGRDHDKNNDHDDTEPPYYDTARSLDKFIDKTKNLTGSSRD